MLGNLSLSYIKLGDYTSALEFVNKALEIIESHLSITSLNINTNYSSKESKTYVIKLLYRKAEIFSKISRKEEAYSILSEILGIDSENKEVKNLLQTIEEEKNLTDLQKIKESAAEYLKNNDVLNALSLYNEALKKVSQKNIEGVIDYLAILLNKALCHLKLEQFDDIINIGIRGLKLIKSLKNSIIAFESKKLTKDQKVKLTNFELRFLIRRSNAYLRQNQ